MASSSSSQHHGQQRPARIVRRNSSFLGTIKSIVSAPLGWFGNQDDDATPGKRRRAVEQTPTEPILNIAAGSDNDNDIDDTIRRSKRMRLQSPSRASQPYLDPPAAALRRADSTRRASAVPRASSAILPSSSGSWATLSPRRRLSIARTMSIDPPHLLPIRRDSSFNFALPSSAESDFDMVVDSFGDSSRPSSPRPSFRMRSSMTPQPQQPPQRYISEPPPLNFLISKPTFVHPPAQAHEPSPVPTLGSLADSVRTTQSPVRHNHSSLIFGSNPNTTNHVNGDAPAERALHQLDVYKTPLLPTRMRSSNLPASIVASTTPDMFKSRGSSHLVLMQDDRDRLGKKVSGSGKSPVVNETKPYAGEGGMKKLLARRKLELEEEGEENDQSKDTSSTSVSLDSAPGSGRFSTVASAPGERSLNLRVGRSQSFRNHPRPYKANFSAKFDEEPDDVSEKANYHRQKKREMLKEAAKKAPAAELPTDFSFAKNSVSVDGMEEVPTTSLPFPLFKPSSPASESASKRVDTSVVPPIPEVPVVPIRIPTPEPKVHTPAPSKVPPGFSLVPGPLPPPVPSAGGIPNFFASSLTKDPPPAAPVSELTSSSTSGTASAPLASPSAFSSTAPSSQPVNDLENPFWDGDQKKAEEASKLPQSVFGTDGTTSAKVVTPTPTPLFGGVTSAFLPLATVDTASSASRPGFSFAKLSQEGETSDTPPKAPEPPKLPFSFGTSSDQNKLETNKPETETIAPKPLFAASNTSSTLFGDSAKPASLFAEPPKAIPFGITGPPQSTPSPLPFSFGSSTSQSTTVTAAPVQSSQSTLFGAASTAPAAADASKSVFGNPGAFSFAPEPVQKAKEVKTAPAPFSFGTALSTPPTAPVPATKPAPIPAFSFDQSSTNTSSSIAAPISFTFSGGGSASADVSNKQLFMFGQTNPIAPTARPVTPPKNSDNEFRMEESPTREMQQTGNGKLAESRPTLDGFSFVTNNSGSNAGSSLFGGGQNSASVAPSSTPFSFGGSSLANPFAPKNPQPEEPKGFAGFGQTTPVAPTLSTTFSFGQQLKSPEDAQRSSTTGPFSFAATPTSATSATPAFSFSGTANSNPFGQPPSRSAPSSPSTFSQPSSFAFGAPAASAGGAFAFGSQPASPAGGANLTLPQSSFGTGGGFGQSAPQQPSSPFNSPLPLAPSTSSGGSLFTMGSAPAPAANGPRQIKKLPNRRGGVKR